MKTKEIRNISPCQALKFIFRFAPGSFLLMALLELLLGLASLLSVILTRQIFSLVQEGYTPRLLITLVLYGVSLLLCAGYSFWYIRYHVQFYSILKFEEKIRTELHKKSHRLSNEALESPKVYAYLRQADGARQNLFRYVQIHLDIVFACVHALLLTAYLSGFEVWFLILLPLSLLPVLLDLLYKSRLWQRDFESSSQCRREEEAYTTAMADSAACKESRVTGGDALLMKKWAQSRSLRDTLSRRKERTMLILHLATAPLTVAASVGGLITSGILLYQGAISFPVFAAGTAAYESLLSILRSVAESVENEVLFRKLIDPFFRYWKLPERTGTNQLDFFPDEIRFEDVSFRYPGADSDAISHLSFTLKKGEVLAVVGENGAGKTTLANLILGVFQPTQGRIFYGSQNLIDLQEASLHRFQSTVTQSFVHYETTAGDNISLGDPQKKDSQEISRRLETIFPDGGISAETALGKQFGGRDLSGGQWQQLSCARGFYKQAAFLLLDEPTSAIDPLKEKALIESFREELKGKTGILITHRLGAVSLADKVLVLEDGQLSQYGTARELLQEEGLYKALWDSQTAAYN